MISFKEFKNLEMKIGTITKVEEIPGSKNLIKLKIDLGDTTKQAVAGIKNIYKINELEGKQFVFITNLEPAKLMGQLSEVMILAADDGNNVVLIKPERTIANGSMIK